MDLQSTQIGFLLIKNFILTNIFQLKKLTRWAPTEPNNSGIDQTIINEGCVQTVAGTLTHPLMLNDLPCNVSISCYCKS